MKRVVISALLSILLLGVIVPLTVRTSGASESEELQPRVNALRAASEALKAPASAAFKAPASAGELLQHVNALRAANGLPPYKSNSALMGAAQAHSDYQAATGNTSHTGKGGSRPRDRAVAWGYGGGAAVNVSENIATGTGMSAADAVSIWQGDGLHLNTMLSTSYRDAGVGAAEADGVVYYTLDVGYVSGDEGQPPSAPPGQGGDPGSTQAPAGTPVAVVIQVVAATPLPDGSIIHEVQPGQALWNISTIYQVGLPFILTLNGISEDTIIYPGDKLVIRPPDATPTPKVSPTPEEVEGATPTESSEPPSPAPTRRVFTPQGNSSPEAGTPSAALAKSASHTPGTLTNLAAEGNNPSGAITETPSQGIDPLLFIIGGLVIAGTLLLLLGRTMQRGA